MTTRIFPPLKADHPLVADNEICPSCKKFFYASQRIVLVPIREPQMGYENVEVLVVHATCALAGAKTPVGIVKRIKDGDGSPFPVVTKDGKQHTFSEAGYIGD